MASAGPLEDHIKCTKCTEIYCDPYTLKCLHTFCYQCIQQLLQWNKVQCPECSQYSTNDVIRQDVKIQAFINYYHQQQDQSCLSSDNVKDTVNVQRKCVTVCEMCEATDKPIKCKCIECNQFMCSSCDVTHRGMRICKNHTVRPIEDEIKAIQTKVSSTISVLEEEKINAKKASRRISEAIDGIKISQTSQIADVNRYVDYLVRDMENYRQYLQQTIQETNDTLVSGLMGSQNNVDTYEKELQVKIDKLSETVISKDIGVLTEAVHELEFTKPEDVKQIQTVFLNEHNTIKSCVQIEKGEKWDLQKSLRITIIDSRNEFSDDNSGEELYSQLAKLSFKKDVCEKLDNVPNRLCIINDEIWCAAESLVYVYDKQCKRIKTIKHKNIQNVHGITQTHTGHIILACHSNKGLKILDITGKYIGQILSGSFSDVCAFNEKIYALEYSSHKLVVLHYENSKWVEEKRIDLNYSNGSTVDKVCVNRQGIHISSFFNHCLYIYTYEGEFLYEKGQEGSGNAGLLQSPSLCDVDLAGNVLVADQGNHVLQVYVIGQDHWEVVQLPGEIRCPTHAVMDQSGENIWVVTYNSRQLVKYVKL